MKWLIYFGTDQNEVQIEFEVEVIIMQLQNDKILNLSPKFMKVNKTPFYKIFEIINLLSA